MLARATNMEREANCMIRRPLCTIDFKRDPGFIGREANLREIDRRFATESRVALYGLGGMG
jgi:hypothetical protein